MILALFSFILPITALLASKGVVPLLLLTVAAAAVAAWRGRLRPPLPDLRLASLVLALLVWCAITAIWSFRPADSILLVARVAVIFAAALAGAALAGTLEADSRARIGQAFTAGMIVTLVIIGFELAFDFPLLRILRGTADSSYEELSRLNRGLTAMAMLIWPLAALHWRRGLGKRALLAPLLLLATIAFLESSAATLGLACGAVMAGTALVHRRAGQVLLIAFLAIALAAGPGIAKLAMKTGWAESELLGGTARYRIHIWNFTAERILERPILGWGFDSSRAMPNFGEQAFFGDGRVIPLHPHNAPLQVLLELGALGGLVVFALLLVMTRPLTRAPPPARVCGQAMFVCTLAIASTAYGIWQNQWLALIAASVIVFLSVAPPRPPEPIPD
jgi:O-antigen ligase